MQKRRVVLVASERPLGPIAHLKREMVRASEQLNRRVFEEGVSSAWINVRSVTTSPLRTHPTALEDH